MNQMTPEPLLDLDFLSHGTLLMDDMAATRRFYEEFLGLDVIRTSQISLAFRLNSDTTVACVALSKKVRQPGREYLRHYNSGLSVGDVGQAHGLALEHAEAYGMRNVGDVGEHDGRLSFLIEDLDGNYWEILDGESAP